MNFFQQPFDGLQGILPYFVSLYLSHLYFRTDSYEWFSITYCLSCLVELSVQHDYIVLYIHDVINGTSRDSLGGEGVRSSIVRSVVFVEGGLNTNCTVLSKFVWLVLLFKYETNLRRKYKRNNIWVNIIYINLKGCCNYSTVYGMEIPLNKTNLENSTWTFLN